MRRCIHDVLLCVLEYLSTRDEVGITEIMHHCRIDTRLMRKIVKISQEFGLAQVESRNSRKIMKITDKGRTLLDYLRKVNEMVRS